MYFFWAIHLIIVPIPNVVFERVSSVMKMHNFAFNSHSVGLHVPHWASIKSPWCRTPAFFLQVNVSLPTNRTISIIYHQLGDYQVVKMSAHEYHFPHNGISLGFEFKLKRRSTYVTHLFLAPSIICGLLTPFLFILPHGEDANLTLGKVDQSTGKSCWKF